MAKGRDRSRGVEVIRDYKPVKGNAKRLRRSLPHLSTAQLKAATVYYARFPQEIDAVADDIESPRRRPDDAGGDRPARVRFYLDEDLTPVIAVALRKRGVDAVSAHDLGRIGLSDAEQLTSPRARGGAWSAPTRGISVGLVAMPSSKAVPTQESCSANRGSTASTSGPS